MSVKSRKSANGRLVYDVYYADADGRRTCKRGLPKQIAYDLDDKIKRTKAAGRAGIDAYDITVGHLAQSWLEFKRARVKPSTYEDYASLYDNHIKEEHGDTLLHELRPMSIQRHIDGLADKPRTANKTLTVWRAMLRQAVVWGYLETSPAASVHRLPESPVERQFLTVEEAAALLSVLEGRNRLLVFCALATGMRAGELAGLRWDDVADGRIRVERTYRHKRFSTPKTQAGRREVLMPAVLAEEMERYRRPDGELVFAGPAGQPLNTNELSRSLLRPALRRAGVKKKLSFHDLRHTCAAWLISQGESPRMVQEHLGHSSAAFTMSRYGHLAPDAKQAAIDRFSKLTLSNCNHELSEQKEDMVEL